MGDPEIHALWTEERQKSVAQRLEIRGPTARPLIYVAGSTKR